MGQTISYQQRHDALLYPEILEAISLKIPHSGLKTLCLVDSLWYAEAKKFLLRHSATHLYTTEELQQFLNIMTKSQEYCSPTIQLPSPLPTTIELYTRFTNHFPTCVANLTIPWDLNNNAALTWGVIGQLGNLRSLTFIVLPLKHRAEADLRVFPDNIPDLLNTWIVHLLYNIFVIDALHLITLWMMIEEEIADHRLMINAWKPPVPVLPPMETPTSWPWRLAHLNFQFGRHFELVRKTEGFFKQSLLPLQILERFPHLKSLHVCNFSSGFLRALKTLADNNGHQFQSLTELSIIGDDGFRPELDTAPALLNLPPGIHLTSLEIGICSYEDYTIWEQILERFSPTLQKLHFTNFIIYGQMTPFRAPFRLPDPEDAVHGRFYDMDMPILPKLLELKFSLAQVGDWNWIVNDGGIDFAIVSFLRPQIRFRFANGGGGRGFSRILQPSIQFPSLKRLIIKKKKWEELHGARLAKRVPILHNCLYYVKDDPFNSLQRGAGLLLLWDHLFPAEGQEPWNSVQVLDLDLDDLEERDGVWPRAIRKHDEEICGREKFWQRRYKGWKRVCSCVGFVPAQRLLKRVEKTFPNVRDKRLDRFKDGGGGGDEDEGGVWTWLQNLFS